MNEDARSSRAASSRSGGAAPGGTVRPGRRALAALLLIAALASGLRLVKPGESPPGLMVDAAANAWNTRCLLATGKDWNGDRWPVFYSRCFGENRSTLYFYALMPFQLLGGMSAETTPLPSAVGGVVSVLLAFVVASRLFGTGAGLAAAALLGVAPWHLFLSRWGHESGLVPLLTLAPLAALLSAGVPVPASVRREPRPLASLLAGVLTGICCYGYPAVRLFLPPFLLAALLVNPREVGAWLRSRKGRTAALALVLGVAVTLGPLAWKHLTDPAISKRGSELLIWSPSDPIERRIEAAVARYAAHFGPDFLFVRGDLWPLERLPASGPFPWYALPLLALGAVAAVREARGSAAARVLLVWIVLYPIADVVTAHPSPHLLRSAPGLCGLVLLAAFGAHRAVVWLRHRSRGAAVALVALLTLWAAASTAGFARGFFGAYDRDPGVRHVFNADLLEASRWLRTRLATTDAVFFSCADSAALNQPFVVVLVGLRYEPDQWFRDPLEITRRPDTDIVRRFGKVRFLFDRTDVEKIREVEGSGGTTRAIFVLRPGEKPRGTLAHEIRGPDGRVTFRIYGDVI